MHPRRFAIQELSALSLGLALSMAVLLWAAGGETTSFEDLALGEITTSYYATVPEGPIHCRGVEDAEACLATSRHLRRDRVALWLGNSQIHAINQFEEGQETAVAILHRTLATRGISLLAFSQPNANLQEHLTLFTWLRGRLEVDTLILPIVFDDLRETGVRSSIQEALSEPDVAKALEEHEIGRQIAANTMSTSGGDLAGLEHTFQKRVESALNDWLAQHSKLWELRPEARGLLFNRLHRLRNTVFGIDARSKRHLVESIYRDNMAAFEAILADARDEDISVIAYIAPLRDDVVRPYVTEEYEAFKRDAGALARRHGAHMADLEGVVPNRYWGTRDAANLEGTAEVDFMHFQSVGHRVLAEEISEQLATTSSLR